MNIEQLAEVFDGLAKGLAGGLKEKEKKELTSLVGMFHRFPNQGVSDFIKFVEGAFSKERNSVPVLVERIRAVKEGSGEPVQELESSLAGISASDLKKLVTALKMKTMPKKDDNLKTLQSYLSNGQSMTVACDQVDLSAEVDKAYGLYQSIKADFATLSVENIRARYSEQLSGLSTAVLKGLLQKLGYPSDGTRKEIETTLLSNLTSLKVSYEQSRQIAS